MMAVWSVLGHLHIMEMSRLKVVLVAAANTTAVVCFLAHRCAAGSARSPRTPSPIPSKAVAMPADNRLGCHHDKGFPPAEPQSSQRYPEQPIEGAKPRTRPLGMQDQQLLSQRQILQSE